MQTSLVAEHIKNWILNYSKLSKTKGFIIGISGGVDSAVTSTLAAATGLKIVCLEMPIHQNKNQVNRAKKHIKWLKENFVNVSSIEFELTQVFEKFKSKLNNESNKLALANTRARLRMTTLYYFAQHYNLLVLGTGNKVEDFGIGFFTKYGDGGVDLSPIADLLKSEVQEIAEYLKINTDIINAPPTDGLWENNRTDEEQIGASYAELEWAMNFKGNLKLLSKRKKQVLEIYKSFNKKNQHKMNPIPICIIPKKYKI
ncbi:MAG: NAD(+) synthase [Flavobacteriales bacterium]|nr:NAD(+) synthase [Flavobacteriales bacterium]|tara:strand:+ start:88044 stop:88814 length:771 start_codon:yes stop_codon:yes gene_type:complete